MLAAASVGVSCYYEVEQVITRYDSPTVFFARLDGEALHVALLQPDRIRERWKDFVDKLSAYYNTPGRLAVFRRQFENVHRCPVLDPATFATELGILALRGFSDMKEKARDLMVRNKFIASQQSCDLRRHLDSVGHCRQLPHLGESCGAGSHIQVVPGPSVQTAEVTHASSGDRQFGVQSRKCDAGIG